jgi:hypothetical protein
VLLPATPGKLFCQYSFDKLFSRAYDAFRHEQQLSNSVERSSICNLPARPTLACHSLEDQRYRGVMGLNFHWQQPQSGTLADPNFSELN